MADWIKLKVNASHPKILRLADTVDEGVHAVLGRIVQWFHWLDHNCKDGQTGIGQRGLLNILGTDNGKYIEGMVDVEWIELTDDGLVIAVEFDNNFGQCAKRRALQQRRVCAHRKRTESAQKAHRSVNQNENENKITSPKGDVCAAPAARTHPEKAPRKPNPIWDTLAAEFYADGVPKAEQPRLGRIVANLAELHAAPEEIRARIKRYRQEWPDCECTPEALLKHWSRFRANSKQGSTEIQDHLRSLEARGIKPRPIGEMP